MAEWLVEEGIGEHRAIRLSGERITHARLDWPDTLSAGTVLDARLVSRRWGSARGLAQASDGSEVLVDRLPKSASEGAMLRIAIHRSAIAERGRFKRAQGRPSTAEPYRPTLAERLRDAGDAVLIVHRFPACDWDELIGEALEQQVAFNGGTLLFAPTPALTTVDVDGALPPAVLARAAVPALACAIARFDCAGSIAVDFPTLPDKADRRALDSSLGEALADWPHERTAINGFGLVQLVARLERPSLLQLAAWRRGALVWRQLLRRAERLSGPGTIELAIAPALAPAANPAHLAELQRRSGRRVHLREDAALAFTAPHAQLLSDG